VIDLHTHTTASDGRCTPAELVARAHAAAVTVLAVTDHDTVGGCERAQAACRDAAIEFVPGIEITATCEDADVHVLGYFIDVGSPALLAFLLEQRRQRIDRVRQMVEKLAKLGMPLDADAVLEPAIADPRRSAGRPWIARALVAAGFVSTTDEAFDRWLERGKPGFVARSGPSPAHVFSQIHAARGLASLAHPGLLRRDQWIDGFAGEGLDALEVYHSKHDAPTTARYKAMAARLGIAVSGGSDFHADPLPGAERGPERGSAGGPERPGCVSLPREEYERLVGLKPDHTPAS
jgi:predicted metal-dependent phosphoesterase TrpH